jgi:hypothetical protein
LALLLQGCFSIHKPLTSFQNTPHPAPLDYRQPTSWAALPDRPNDPTDRVPRGRDLVDGQASATADVFYVHPTVFNSDKSWLADPRDKKYNRTADITCIKHQATVFNGSCRVYAPRYRQAAIACFFDSTAYAAFDTAYADVRAAFLHYIAHENKGRPFFLAGHSQGSGLLMWLLRREVYGTPLMDRLVAAYLIGLPSAYNWPTEPIPFCCEPDQTGCFLAYNTFNTEGMETHKRFPFFSKPQCVNPLTFTCGEDTAWVPRTRNLGSVNLLYRLSRKPLFDAQVRKGALATHRVRGRLYFAEQKTDYHIMEYNLYWMNLRHNVAQRLAAYQARQHRHTRPEPSTANHHTAP